jgi:hypothetical protein
MKRGNSSDGTCRPSIAGTKVEPSGKRNDRSSSKRYTHYLSVTPTLPGSCSSISTLFSFFFLFLQGLNHTSLGTRHFWHSFMQAFDCMAPGAFAGSRVLGRETVGFHLLESLRMGGCLSRWI